MSDTIVDPPPSTQRDDVLAPPVRPTVPDEPPPRRRLGAVVVALVVVAAALGAVVAWMFLLRYEPVARRHVPSNAAIVVRLDAATVAFFPPVRKHLWPLVGEGAGGSPVARAAAAGAKPLSERLRAATGIDARDLRELVLASHDGASWVAIAGGRFPRGRFVSGVEKLLQEDGRAGWSRQGDVLVGPGIALAQADDGSILAGTDAAIVTAALPATDAWRALALPEAGVATYALTKEAWSGAAGAVASLPHGYVLGKIDSANGELMLGDAPKLTMRARPSAGADPAELARETGGVLDELRVVTLLLPDVAGEKDALRSARVEAKDGLLVLDAPWPLDGLDRGCARLAAMLGAAPGAPPAASR